MKHIQSQLKAGAVLNYVIVFLNIAVQLLYTPFMLRKLGQSEYGLYSLVASVIAYLTIMDFGLGNAIIRYTAKLRAENKQHEQYELFGTFLILYSIVGVLTCIVGLCLYFNLNMFFGDTMSTVELSKAKIMVLILVFNLSVSFPMSIFGSIITAYERFIFPRVINIIRIVLNTMVMIALLSYGYKAIAMVIVQTVFNILTLIVNFIYCKKELHIKLCFSKISHSFFKEIIYYSFWIFLNVLMDKIYWSTGQFVLGAISGTIAVSIYAVAIHLHSFFMHFSSAISNVFLPKVTSMVTLANNNKLISDLFIKVGRIQFIIMSFILSGYVVFGRDFVILWAGDEYSEAYVIALLFFVALIIPTIQTLGITILQARNQMKFRSLLYIVIAIVSLVFQVLLSKRYGAVGCAIAVSAALFIGQGLIMNFYYSRKQAINMREFWQNILKMSLIPIIVTACFCYVRTYFEIDSWIKLILSICLFSSFYIPLFYSFSMNSYEKGLTKQMCHSILCKLHFR